MGNLKVFKFGGTSIGNPHRLDIVRRLVAEELSRSPVVCVVSALNPTDKATGTTNQLLAMAEASAAGETYLHRVDELVARHRTTLHGTTSDTGIADRATDALDRSVVNLLHYLKTGEGSRQLTQRQLEQVMGCGEVFAAILVAGVLCDLGIAARVVDLSESLNIEISADSPVPFSEIRDILKPIIQPYLDEGTVPVVTGYLGRFPGGLLSQVGRGYSDFTAGLVASSLGAESLTIWKDVDGIYTADPNIVSNAHVQRHLSPNEATELTRFGSEVLHTMTIARVAESHIPIVIRNAFNLENSGTLIDDLTPALRSTIKSITAMRGITVLNVRSNRKHHSYGFLSRLFKVLEVHNITVDLITTSDISVSITVSKDADLDMLITDLSAIGQVSLKTGQCILSLIGEGIQTRMDIAGGMFALLASIGVQVEMISQGASRINISCVIKEEDADRSIKSLHHHFIQDRFESYLQRVFSA